MNKLLIALFALLSTPAFADFGPVPAPVEVPWITSENTRTVVTGVSDGDIREFYFTTPNNRVYGRQITGGAYKAGQDAFKQVSVIDPNGNVVASSYSTGPTFNFLVSPRQKFGYITLKPNTRYTMIYKTPACGAADCAYYIDSNHSYTP